MGSIPITRSIFPLQRTITLRLIILLAVFLRGARADDWPQWRGPDRTGHAADDAMLLTNLPAEVKVIWKIPAGDGIASPIIARGIVYQFDNQGGKETIRALHASDAKEIWRHAVDDVFQDEQGPPGPRCTPLLDGDRIYAQSGKGELQCLDAADGTLIWHVSFTNDFGAAFLGEDSKVPGAAEHGYTAAPLIAGERLIACIGGTNGTGIVCFNKRTGKILWKSQDDLAAYAAPVLANPGGVTQAICFTVEGLVGLTLDEGRVLWRVPLKTSYGRNCTTPVIVRDWVVAGSYKAGLIGVQINVEGNGLRAERRWVNKAAAMNFSSPVAVGNYIFGLGPAKNLICVELETGRIAWSKEGFISTSADAAYAAFLVVGKNILVSTDTGELALIAADAKECRSLGRVQVCGKNWCHPAYSRGRIYVRDGMRANGNLFCVEISSSGS